MAKEVEIVVKAVRRKEIDLHRLARLLVEQASAPFGAEADDQSPSQEEPS